MRFSGLTPTEITDFLKRKNLIHCGRITGVDIRENQTIPFLKGKINHLAVSFSADADAAIPKEFVFKVGKGSKEVFFYNEVLPVLERRLAPHCYFAEFEEATNSAILLLEDLSHAYTQTQWPFPPDYAACETVIKTLACLHAQLWNDPLLDRYLETDHPGGNWWEKRIDNAIERLPDFIGYLGDRLSADRLSLFNSILSSGECEWRPSKIRTNRTFLHGDAHFWNSLIHRDATAFPAILIDWNSWDVGRAANDLAYMMGLHWYPERRQRFEKPLLRSYIESLHSSGVSDYHLADLILDYRYSAIMNLFIPVWQWQHGIHPSVWWFHLERAFLTFDDMECRELL